MALFSFTTSRCACTIALILVCTLSTMSLLHSTSPHQHPDESAHHEGGADNSATVFFVDSHGHEDKMHLFSPIMFAIITTSLFALSEKRIRNLFIREIRRAPTRKPLLFTLLFAGGILHPRIP